MEQVLVSGIVLAGGRSSRFGGNKLEALMDGRPLLHRAVDAVALVADEVIVVAAADGSAPELPVVERPVRVVRDAEPFGGPLAGLVMGATDARHSVLLVVGGDMPSLVPGVLRLLIDGVVAGAQAAVLDGSSAPRDGSPGGQDTDPRPLPLALDRGQAVERGASRLAAGDRSIRALLASLETVVILRAVWRPQDPDGATLRDVDRMGNLAPAPCEP